MAPAAAAAVSAERVPASSVAVRSSSPECPVQIIESRCHDYIVCALLLTAIAVPTVIVAVVLAAEWQSSASQRGWLILGFGFYIVTGLRYLWSELMLIYYKMLYLRVEVRRYAAPTLFEAITYTVSEEAEKVGGTCSFDHEAVQENDKLTGRI